MKREISPATFISVIAIVVLVVGVMAWRFWLAPHAVPDKSATDVRSQLGPMAGGGGPPPEALRYRDEYNRTHPGAQGSR